MSIYYLDIDDEITSAAARIRDSSDSRIALVLSGGARVATSRINFRLLAREARHRNKRLAIITADPSVQSVARSAELPVYPTVGDYERAEAAFARGIEGRSAPEVSDALDQLALTVGASGGAAQAGRTGATRVPIGPSGSGAATGRRRTFRLLAVGIAALAVVVAVACFFFFYPSATVTLTLREDPLGPMTVSVTVDPSVSAANDQTGTVPGVSKSFLVEASGTFDATGQNVVETAATGAVTFSSMDTGRKWAIPSGTQVSTANGTAFVTTAAAVVPAAVFSTSTRGVVNAPIAAVNKGLGGNVAANTIVNMPNISGNGLLSVSNASATTGGTHTVTPQVQQSDIDAAQASLLAQLAGDFNEAVKAPGAVPSGSTLFLDSAQLGPATCSPDPAGLLGQDVASFQIDCRASGTATVVDMTTVRSLAERRAIAAVRTGDSLLDNSIDTSIGVPTAQGPTVVVPVTVRGAQVQTVDLNQLRSSILGKSVADARTLLSRYGQVDIVVSPAWASTMPSFNFRIDFRLVVPPAQPSAASSSSTSPGSTKGTVVPPATIPGSTPAAVSPSGSAPATPTPGLTELPSVGASASPSTARSDTASAAPSPSPLPSPAPST
jgi:hypothetical protein